MLQLINTVFGFFIKSGQQQELADAERNRAILEYETAQAQYQYNNKVLMRYTIYTLLVLLVLILLYLAIKKR